MIAYVPNATVKDISRQTEVTGKRCKWINQIQEFDIDFKISQVIKGQGLARLLAEADVEESQINEIRIEEANFTIEHIVWYKDIMYYLKHMKCLGGMIENQKRALKLQHSKYVIVNGDL